MGKIRLSASAIADFKACPYRYYLAYVLGIRPSEDTESQRIGSVWHTCQHILNQEPESVCRECAERSKPAKDCVFCRGNQYIPEDRLALVVQFLDERYSKVPDYLTPEEYKLEYVKMLYSIYGYNWYWGDPDFKVVASEISFNIPVRDPETGRVLLDCETVGRIDKLIKMPNGIPAIIEHKSTSRSIDSDSSVWQKLRLDTQKKLYVYALQQLQKAGELTDLDIPKSGCLSSCFYDYFHKPTISPKKLTQADSKKFVEIHEYYDNKDFEIKWIKDDAVLEINGETVNVESGKKAGAFTIRETPEMYGCRLLNDITERPEFYFARREIAVPDLEIKQFETEIYNILRTIKQMKKANSWFHNESQCEATFKCSFTPFCYNGVEPDINSLPDRFKCIFNKEKE